MFIGKEFIHCVFHYINCVYVIQNFVSINIFIIYLWGLLLVVAVVVVVPSSRAAIKL